MQQGLFFFVKYEKSLEILKRDKIQYSGCLIGAKREFGIFVYKSSDIEQERVENQ